MGKCLSKQGKSKGEDLDKAPYTPTAQNEKGDSRKSPGKEESRAPGGDAALGGSTPGKGPSKVAEVAPQKQHSTPTTQEVSS